MVGCVSFVWKWKVVVEAYTMVHASKSFQKCQVEMFVIVLDHHTCYAWEGKKVELESLIYTSHSCYQLLQIMVSFHCANVDSTASTTCRSVTRINLPRTPSASHPPINTTRSV